MVGTAAFLEGPPSMEQPEPVMKFLTGLGEALEHYASSPTLSGPTATVILSRYTVALHSVARRFPGFEGVSQENCGATPPEKAL